MSVRGNVTATIDGKEVPLSLTLGAMERIEDELKVDNINEAIVLVGTMKMRALRVFIEAAAAAAGSEIDAKKLDPKEAVAAVGKLVNAAFPDEDDDGDAPGDAGAPAKN